MELKSGDFFCLFYKFLWKDHRGDRKEKTGEGESAKRSKY